MRLSSRGTDLSVPRRARKSAGSAHIRPLQSCEQCGGLQTLVQVRIGEAAICGEDDDAGKRHDAPNTTRPLRVLYSEVRSTERSFADIN